MLRQRKSNHSAAGIAMNQNGNQPNHVLVPRRVGTQSTAIEPSTSQDCTIARAIVGVAGEALDSVDGTVRMTVSYVGSATLTLPDLSD